jgi:hypothetical protein
METEMIQTVLNELVEELKELKQQDAKLVAVVGDLDTKVGDYVFRVRQVLIAPVYQLHRILIRYENLIDSKKSYFQIKPHAPIFHITYITFDSFM